MPKYKGTHLFDDGVAVGSVATTIKEDGSGNLEFVDAVAGKRYLAGLRCFNGFENRTDSIISIESGSLKIVPTITSYVVYSRGERFIVSDDHSVAITNEKTLHYVFFVNNGDGTLTLSVGTDFWDVEDSTIFVAICFKQDSVITLQDERHNARVNPFWHKWNHEHVGTVYNRGLTGVFSDTDFSITQGEIDDEDLDFDTGETKTACTLWFRDTDPAKMQLIRGAPNCVATVETSPGVFDLAYDLDGVLTAVSGTQRVVSWVYATPDQDEPIYCLISQNHYANNNQARNAELPIIRLSTAEWKLLYKVIYRRNGTGSYLFVEAIDYRVVQNGIPIDANPVSSHASLIDRDAADSHPASAISVEITDYPDMTDVQAALTSLFAEASGTITRVGGLVTEITIDSRTITINRDIDGVITGWEDAVHEWTLTRDGDGIITSWGVTAK
jgi:hypothetical protein